MSYARDLALKQQYEIEELKKELKKPNTVYLVRNHEYADNVHTVTVHSTRAGAIEKANQLIERRVNSCFGNIHDGDEIDGDTVVIDRENGEMYIPDTGWVDVFEIAVDGREEIEI